MTRIPKSELAALKRAVPLADLVRERVALAKRGADLVGLCPFHEDDTPSLVVTESKGLWHCFGCDAGGSAVDWVMGIDDVEFIDAVKTLKTRYMPALATTATAAKLLAHLEPSSTDADVMGAVAAYYAACFEIFDEGRAYLEGRGISSSTARSHGVGFAGGLISNDLPKEGRADLRRRLQDLGVLRSTGHEHFRGCITVPLVDAESGDVVAFYGRRVEGEKPGQPSHMYPPGKHRGVFHRRGFELGAAAGSLIVCEAVIDALSFLEQGIDNVTAVYGAAGIADDIVTCIKTAAVPRIVCAFDPDEAGDRGYVSLQALLPDVEMERVPLPSGLDVNSYAAANSLQALLDGQHVPMPVTMLPPPKPTQGLVSEGDDEAAIVFGDRSYRVRGLSRMMTTEALKVQLVATRRGMMFSDTLDLFVSKARSATAVAAASQLDADSKDLNDDLIKIFHIVDDIRRRRRESSAKPKEVVLTPDEHDAAMELLRDPQLIRRIVVDFDRCGVVGEEINKLVAYLGATSRKLKKPLAVMVQSSSAAGKSSLMDAVLAFVPDEDKEVLSAITGQALFYADMNLEHKVLSIAEEEGAQSAAYPLKILQSEGKLQLLTTVKDPVTQQNVAKKHEVKGPVSLLSSTTAIEMDEELLNRCIVLTVDESRAQTRRIHARQRELETLEGKQLLIEREKLVTLHQNAQRLLKAVDVVNPFANELTFFDEKTRARRDHTKFLTLIRIVALLHQHQRPTLQLSNGTPYIEVTREDLAMVDELASAVLNRSLDDVPPKTRELFDRIVEMVDAKQPEDDPIDVWFTVRDVVDALTLSDTIVTKHLARLQKAELIETGHRSGHGQRLWFRLVRQPNAFALESDGQSGETARTSDETASTSSPPPAPFQPRGAGGFPTPNTPKDNDNLKTSSPVIKITDWGKTATKEKK